MNLVWVAAISALVIAEKLLAHGQWLHRFIGALAFLAAIAAALRQTLPTLPSH